MEIIVTTTDGEYGRSEELYVNGKFSTSVCPMCECPEDATIERDLISCSDIANYMRQAYEAGKNGEDFTITYEEGE